MMPAEHPLPRRPRKALGLLVLALAVAGCGQDPFPKPRGYFRIDLPADSAIRYTDPCAFTALVPAYARMVPLPPANGVACRTDMRFPGQHAAVHLTWRSIQGDLPELIHDAHEFKDKHLVVASRVRTEEVLRSDDGVFGTLFDVEGNVASPMIFYLTDSTANFLYGALYFDARPNADSLAPVSDRLRADIRRFARTLSWKVPAGAVQHVQQGHQ